MHITDRDLNEMPLTPTPGEEEFDIEPPTPAFDRGSAYHRDGSKVTYLGFHPPSDKPLPGVRARRSRNKKAMLRAIGADG